MPTQLILGNSIIQDGVASFDCWRSRKEPVDVLTWSFSSAVSMAVQAGAAVEFLVAYAGGELRKVFAGEVDQTSAPYRARDKMAGLMTPVRQSFEQVAPQEVFDYVLRPAGLKSVMTAEKFARRNFVTSVPSFYDLIVQVNSAWGVQYDGYFDLQEQFNWRPREEQSTLPVFAYGENIIDLSFDGAQGSLLTLLYPDVEHSQLVAVEHPDIDAEVLVDTVHHFTNDNGGMRTEIFFSLPE